MYRLSSSYPKYIALCAALLLLTPVISMLHVRFGHIYTLQTLIHCALITGWAMSVKRRILHPGVRRLLIASAVAMLALFVLRMCRFVYLEDDPFLSMHLWYAYYLPMTLSPMLLFFASMRVGTERRTDAQRNVTAAFCAVGLFFCAAVMTNDLHGRMFVIPDFSFPNKYTHGALYYAVVLWIAFLILGSFAILMRKCRLSVIRSLWYVPMIVMIIGMLPITLYFLNGNSALRVNGAPLYHLQEAFCFMLILCAEGFIRIGLIPSNTGYETLFSAASVQMRIESTDGRVLPGSSLSVMREDEDHRLRRAEISGGSVLWMEDVSHINRLNREIGALTEELEDENELIRRENDLRAEWTDVETKRRLYDMIAREVRGEVLSVTGLIGEEADDPQLAARLGLACTKGAFIKRMSNLMLIANAEGALNIRELGMSVRESFEYLTLSGHTCDLIERGEEHLLPSSLVLFAYRLFETLIENTYDTTYAVSVVLEGGASSFEMRILMDAEDIEFDAGSFSDELSALGAMLTIRREDETTCLSLFCQEVAA